MSVWRATPIPAHTDRLHLAPYWLGDSKWSIAKAGVKGRKGGSPDVDLNLILLLDGVALGHWRDLRRGGWLYIQVGKKRRRLTNDELDRPAELWKRADYVRLRQTRFRGVTRRSRVRPLLYVEALELCHLAGARPNFEAKVRFKERAKAMVAQANAHHVTAYFMRLAHQGLNAPRPGYSMAEAGEILRDFKLAGGQTALLAHNYPKPVDLEEWADAYDQVWGRWT